MNITQKLASHTLEYFSLQCKNKQIRKILDDEIGNFINACANNDRLELVEFYLKTFDIKLSTYDILDTLDKVNIEKSYSIIVGNLDNQTKALYYLIYLNNKELILFHIFGGFSCAIDLRKLNHISQTTEYKLIKEIKNKRKKSFNDLTESAKIILKLKYL